MPLTKVSNGVLGSNVITSNNLSQQTLVNTDFSDNSIIEQDIVSNSFPLSTFSTDTQGFSIVTDKNGIPQGRRNFNHCINRVIYNYSGVTRWLTPPDGSFQWVPGLYYDYFPLSSSSTIKFSCQWGVGWHGQTHSISHYMFMVNDVSTIRFNKSGYYMEQMNYFSHYFPSWGRSRGRVGMQSRQYSSVATYGGSFSRHRTPVHATYHFNGGGSRQYVSPQLVIEELLN